MISSDGLESEFRMGIRNVCWFFARFILIDLYIDWTLYCNCCAVGKY